jgi:pimeloyl-ACP methyl ester carboxylesterase
VPEIDRGAGVRVHYEVHGSAGGRPGILLTHGFSATSQMWRANVSAFALDRPVALWDMRGHGRTAAPEDASLYSHELSLGDMSAVLDAAGLERAVLCGMSLGGYLSLAFRLRHPERVAALVLVDTGPGYRRDDQRDAWNAWVQDTAAGLEAEGSPRCGRARRSTPLAT